MKKQLSVWVLAGLAGVPVVAVADEPASPHTLTANIGLTSNYVFRGISQTAGDPAIQGGFDYAHSSGFYLGTWGSNVSWLTGFQRYTSGSMELDLYGGYRKTIGDFSYDLGAIRYMYPGSKNGGGLPGAWTSEAYVAAGWKWFTAKYSYALSDSVFGVGPNANGSYYFDLSGNLPVGDTGLSLGAHWGTFHFKNVSAANYDDWKIGASYDLGKLGRLGNGVTLAVAYTDTNADRGFWTDADGEYLGKNTTTVSISKAF
ncbi:MAG: TorF family putative porin [Betaproteobacteria bacterium]|nr:TorF family putative porin [Betaproteobacteria bacterium]